jgi:hypothetical protein
MSGTPGAWPDPSAERGRAAGGDRQPAPQVQRDRGRRVRTSRLRPPAPQADAVLSTAQERRLAPRSRRTHQPHRPGPSSAASAARASVPARSVALAVQDQRRDVPTGPRTRPAPRWPVALRLPPGRRRTTPQPGPRTLGGRPHRLDPDPETARQVQWIFTQRLAGNSAAGTAAPSTPSGLFRRPRTTGPGTHTAPASRGPCARSPRSSATLAIPADRSGTGSRSTTTRATPATRPPASRAGSRRTAGTSRTSG